MGVICVVYVSLLGLFAFFMLLCDRFFRAPLVGGTEHGPYLV